MEVKMYRKACFTLVVLVGIGLFTSCKPEQLSPTPDANMPNPASVFCEQNGGRLDLRQDASGGVVGVCVFPDGSECDEWTYFRGECKPSSPLLTPASTDSPVATVPAAAVAEEFASDDCRIYRNEELGYSFHYPADAQIITNDEPLKSISVTGPVIDGESWPQFTISHPSDREDYRPPSDVDLEQWLIDHNLLADLRQPDVQIAGLTAIHVRHERSPQSYAYDRYFFAESGQLFMIVIGHTGDKEDWDLYNHFLQSFQFDK